MELVLTHYGHRLLAYQRGRNGAFAAMTAEELALLAHVHEALALPDDGSPRAAQLVERGWLARDAGPIDRHALRLRYQRNPLEHVERVVFELTTLCNLACSHCRNGNLAPTTSGHTDRLLEVVDAMVPLGVRRFDFIGGEVTLYGRGWLDIVQRIREHPETTAAVVTSGWFLGERDFVAANRRYADADAYLRALADAGLTHVIFSLDGPAACRASTTACWRASSRSVPPGCARRSRSSTPRGCDPPRSWSGCWSCRGASTASNRASTRRAGSGGCSTTT